MDGANDLLERMASNSSANLEAERLRLLEESTRDSFPLLVVVVLVVLVVVFVMRLPVTWILDSSPSGKKNAGSVDCMELKLEVITGVQADACGEVPGDVPGVVSGVVSGNVIGDVTDDETFAFLLTVSYEASGVVLMSFKLMNGRITGRGELQVLSSCPSSSPKLADEGADEFRNPFHL